MGQAITSAQMRRVIDANLTGFIEQATSSYARLFGKSPTFSTYYSRDMLSSTVDVNLGGAIQVVGPESPIKYQKINDFPLYGIPEADMTQAYDEIQGVSSNGIRGETFVLPGTLEPQENDFFVIDYLKTQLIFRIVSCHPDRIEGKAFYKIEYVLDHADRRQLDRQTEKSFVFELGTMGTGANPIIEQDVAVVLREMEVIEESYRAAYWRAFYDRASGTLLLRGQPQGPIHDRSLNMFVASSNLLGGEGYHRSRTVRPTEYDDRGQFDDGVYHRTIYGYAERGDMLPTECAPIGKLNFLFSRPLHAGSQFYAEFAIDGYHEAVPSPDGTYWIGGEHFLSRLEDRYIPDENRALRALARRCMLKEGFNTEDPVEALREFNTAFNDTSLLADRADMYWLLPIVLLRAKRFRDAARAAE